jgi:hypothetical protein
MRVILHLFIPVFIFFKKNGIYPHDIDTYSQGISGVLQKYKK